MDRDVYQLVKDKLAICDVLRDIDTDANLRKRGRHWYGRCPSCGQRDATVYVGSGVVHCFRASCSFHGDLFEAIKAKCGCSDYDALERASRLAGVELKPQTPEQREATKQRAKRKADTKAVLTDAALWALERLLERKSLMEGIERNYGFDETTVRHWAIGFVPFEKTKANDGLTNHLLRKGWSTEQIRSASICKYRTSNPSVMRCVYPSRIVFPFWDGNPEDELSRVVYMTGRLVNKCLAEDETLWTPKWDAEIEDENTKKIRERKYRALALHDEDSDVDDHIDPSLEKRPFNESCYAYVPQGEDKKDLEIIPDMIVAVEGPSDAIAIAELGIPAVGMGGASISENLKPWLLRVLRNQKLVILGDNDGDGPRNEKGELRPGLKGALTTARALDDLGYLTTHLTLCPARVDGAKEDPASWVMRLTGTREERRNTVLAHLESAPLALDCELSLLAENPIADDTLAPLMTRIALRPELEQEKWIKKIKAAWKLNAAQVTVIRKKLKEAISVKQRSKLHIAKPGEHAPSQGSTIAEQLGSNVPGGDLRVPDSYELSDQGIEVWVGSKDGPHKTCIAKTPVIPVREILDVSDGTHSVVLAWPDRGKWVHRIASKSEAFGGNASTIKLADNGIPVGGDNAKDLSKFLRVFHEENKDSTPRLRASSRLGWLDNRNAFLLGRTYITGEQQCSVDTRDDTWRDDVVAYQGKDAGDEQIADGFTTAGTLTQWIEIVNSVAQYDNVIAIVLASMAAPLLDIIGLPNFAIDIHGTTSHGKTVALRLAASTWGLPFENEPNSIVYGWDQTKVFFERMSAIRNHLPVFLDDTKRCKRPEDIAATLYASSQGHGKGRGSKAGLALSGSWHHVLISTGEQPMVSYTEDGGTRARVLNIEDPWGPRSEMIGNDVKRVNMAIRDAYGVAGIAVVQWLLRNREYWPELRSNHAGWRAYLGQKTNDGGGCGDRLADYAALIAVMADHAHVMLPGWEATPQGAHAIERIWGVLQGEAHDAVGGKRALLSVYDWSMSHRECFEGYIGVPMVTPRQPSLGWAGIWRGGEDWEALYFYVEQIKKILIDLRYPHPDAILNDWRERGWLETDNAGKWSRPLKHRGNVVRMVAIMKTAIQEVCISNERGPMPVSFGPSRDDEVTAG